MPFGSLSHSEPTTPLADHPLAHLPREDLDLIAELVLQSGSLKDLAASYGVSYPTIRARLDKVIERLRAAVEGRPQDRLTILLSEMVSRGEVSAAAAKELLKAAAERKSGGA